MSTKDRETSIVRKIADAGALLTDPTYPQITEPNSPSGWHKVPLTTLSSDPLIPLGPFSKHRFISTSSAYAGEHITSPYKNGLAGSTMAVFVRESDADRLLQAQKNLPRGLHLLAMDGFRTLEVQQSLYDRYSKDLAAQKPALSSDELIAETLKYVALPSTDPSKPSPHNTGGSIDVMVLYLDESKQKEIERIDAELLRRDPDAEIALHSCSVHNTERTPEAEAIYALEMERMLLMHGGKNSQGISYPGASALEFGVPFDHGTEKSALCFYEGTQLSDEEEAFRNARRMLCWAMTEAGFIAIPSEYWHFNAPESQMGARTAGLATASYGAAKLSEDNRTFDKLRRKHHEETGLGYSSGPKVEVITPQLA